MWSVVSREDEHPASRQFVFGLEQPAGAPSVTAVELEGGAGDTIGSIARLATLIGVLLIVGASVQARWYLLPQIRMAYLVTGGAVAAGGGLLVTALAAGSGRAMTEGPLPRLDGALVVGLLLAGVALVSASLATQAPVRRSRALWMIVVLAGALLAWIVALRSHAGGVGILLWVNVVWQAIDLAVARPGLYALFPALFELARQLNVLVSAIHILAVSAWMGGLLAAGISGLRGDQLSAWHPRFSRFAMRSFVVVALTGLYQGVLYLSSPQQVIESDYGLMLLVKHAFVVGVVGLAGVNRYVIAPALRRDGSRLAQRAVGIVRAEAAIGIAVIGAAVLLATTPPARPPTDIFLRPELIASLAEERQVVSGDRRGWELVIARRSSTTHRFIVRSPDRPAHGGTLVLNGPGEDVERQLQLDPASENAAADGLVLTRDGLWVATLQRPDGDVSFRFDVRGGHVLARHLQAQRTWDQALAETERSMQSARMIDVLTDGLSVMLFAHHDLVAPDRARLEMLGGRQMIWLGDQRYSRGQGEDWQVEEIARPFEWPNYTFLDRVIGVRFAGSAAQAGRPMTVLAGYNPESQVGYEIWVGDDDGLIHRLVMGLPGHYMINAYYDVNEPVSVEPPRGFR